MGDNNVSHHFKKGVKRRNFNVFNMNMQPYLVVILWKGLRTRKIISFRKDDNKILGQNGGVSKLTSCLI